MLYIVVGVSVMQIQRRSQITKDMDSGNHSMIVLEA